MQKALIIRFSSFGDIIHTLPCASLIHESKSDWEADWVVRSDFYELLAHQDTVKKVWKLDRREGLKGLIELALKLRKEKYDIVYDAHNNLRSLILRLFLIPFSHSKLIVRSKSRWKRFLLFYLRKNSFRNPFKAMDSYLAPLKKELSFMGDIHPWKWPIRKEKEELFDQYKGRIVLAPCTAWDMKTWPIDHFKKLIEILEDEKFLLLGGPLDTICEELVKVAPNRVTNLAGKLSYLESCEVVSISSLVISADTGIIQVADYSGVKGLSLIGPTAFGFPTNPQVKVMEVNLECRPCSKDGRGKCSQDIYQKCMVLITPESVAKEALTLLSPSI